MNKPIVTSSEREKRDRERALGLLKLTWHYIIFNILKRTVLIGDYA